MGKVGHWRPVGKVGCALAALVLNSCLTCPPTGGPGYADGDGCCADGVKVCAKPTVRALAHDLDELEEHIEKFGSVVAKQPDVWGQARLTKHREEFEQEMAKELGKFDYSLQGTVSMSDQAYFADAAALSAAVSRPRRAVISTSTATSAAAAPPPAAPPPPQTPLLPPEESDVFAAFSQMKRTPVQMPPTLEFAKAKTGIIVEPTVLLDEKARYLNHLHELRRINEGDDTADSPGYALNLVRIPVSVLPGKCTDVGYGAEVTMTLKPYLSAELLPTTFRNLVLNDLVDQVGFPVTQFLNNPDNGAYLDDRVAADLENLLEYLEKTHVEDMQRKDLESFRWKIALQPLLSRPEWAWVDELLAALKGVPPEEKIRGVMEQRPEVERSVKRAQTSLSRSLNILRGAIPVPAAKSRRARMPFPPTQALEVYGYDFAFHLILDAHRVFARERFSRPCPDSNETYIHLPDVQGYLQEELSGAYKFLSNPANAALWQFCTPELATAVRAHRVAQIKALRDTFKAAVDAGSGESDGRVRHSTTAALAWAILVESALLTDQLVEDMRETAAAKGCACATPGWLPYFLPDPPPEARQAFNDYVRCRWPIHVFALDPVVEEQNLAATFSGRREMQLAMSLAFVGGQISARNMMRYARRIEFDFATVDLNGTAVGFSHGDDTFGWRFYPRFQTPDIESNAVVFFRDLLYGGPSRNALLRQRRLEPGIRECVAIVIMPSFVPCATLDVSSNWFCLTNPKCKELDSQQAMKLSKAVKLIEDCAPNVCDADCYRPGDFQRLLQKAKQLEARLPLQSTIVQIPYENTLGGFAMFNTGITDLAPELIGWYGSPSINPSGQTTVFLVGNHFSVHQTRVIAGGQEVTDREMLSRQVMKAVIPPNPLLLGDPCQGYFVDVHLATPYGVTQHLLIPVCKAPGEAAPRGPVWSPAAIDLAFAYSGVGINALPPGSDPGTRPRTLVIQIDALDPKYPVADVTLKFDNPYAGAQVVIPNVPLNQAKTGYEIPGKVFSDAVFKALGSRFGPEATNPPCPLVATSTTLKLKETAASPPAGAAPPVVEKKTTNNLTIRWVKGAPNPGKGGS